MLPLKPSTITQPPITLTELANEFDHWREARSSRKHRIPEALWEKIGTLLPYYSRSVICRDLKLSGGQLQKKFPRNSRLNQALSAARPKQKQASTPAQKNTFLSVQALPPTTPQPTTPPLVATLSLPSGATLSIYQAPAIAELATLLR